DMNRLEKSPLLANGYNPPPINHMAFMQMNHHPGTALMSPGMPPHGLHARPDSQMLKAAAQSGMSAANMDALARSGIWENCRAAYEDIVKHLERLREERTDERQQMGGVTGIVVGGAEQKPRDLSSRNCSPNRQSPVLNLSKSGGNTDQGSNCDERSERSDMHSPAHSVRDDSIERTSVRSVEVDERMGKDDEDLSDVERDNISPASQRLQRAHNMPHHNAVDRVSVLAEHDATHPALQHGSPSHNAAVAALQHQRALNYSTLAAAAAAANGGASGPSLAGPGSGGGMTPNEALMAANDASTAAAALAAGGLTLGPLAIDPGVPSSTETLLRNIQSLLKVAADNARQQERAITYEKAELKMDVLREREVKDSLERQLVDERKLRDNDGKQSEKSDKSSSSSSLSSINSLHHHSQTPATTAQQQLAQLQQLQQQQQPQSDELQLSQQQQQQHQHQHQHQRHLRHHSESPSFKREPQSDHESRSADDNHQPSTIPHLSHTRALSDSGRHSSSDRLNDRDHDDERRSTDRDSNRPPSSQAENSLAMAAAAAAAAAANGKGQWQYPGIDLVATGAFWQNYSESLAHEIEMERKTRSANADRDVKSPLAERQAAAAYYKNSVLFGSAN
ncbi:hypothetical protein DOY81_010365, partial [Sarcophaga bullata]